MNYAKVDLGASPGCTVAFCSCLHMTRNVRVQKPVTDFVRRRRAPRAHVFFASGENLFCTMLRTCCRASETAQMSGVFTLNLGLSDKRATVYWWSHVTVGDARHVLIGAQ